jgi:hypothetical protein
MVLVFISQLPPLKERMESDCTMLPSKGPDEPIGFHHLSAALRVQVVTFQ